MIPLIQQSPGSGQCLAACVAMITRTNLAFVIGTYGLRFDKERNVEYFTMHNAAKCLLEYNWLLGLSLRSTTKQGIQPEEATIDLSKIPGILAVPSPTLSLPFMHSVVWCPDREAILDPLESEPQDVRRYKIIEWTPLTKITRE